MADLTDSKSKFIQNYFLNNPEQNLGNEDVFMNFKEFGDLSEAEIKFLAVCIEKKNAAKVIENILNSKLTLDNYEEVFCLKEYQALGGTINPEQAVRNIRYRDKHGVIVATVQIDTANKKIRIQNLGDILPKQECFSPEHIGNKLAKLAEYNNWSTEDGGINQFNGNLEHRYKDKNENVMSAIIIKPDGRFDTVVEYEYNEFGYRTQMFLTNHYGQSRVIYDGSPSVIQLTRIDVDTDGMIVEVTKVFG